MIIPPFLKTGDTIGIVAPGRCVTAENIQPAIEILQSWGLNVKLAKHLFSRQHNYLAGSDAERLADVQNMIDDVNVQGILCARGGYGTSRFLDALRVDTLIEQPKWIVGFSDVTALHLKLIKHGVQSIHGTMPLLFAKEDARLSVESLRKCLFGEWESITAVTDAANRMGKAQGKLIGGNLSLIIDSLGTPSEPDTAGKILMIEEIEEYYYKIDRMMNHLNRAGKLKNLAGLVVGHFTAIADTELSFGETLQQIIRYHTRDYQYPVAFHFPFGHENPNMAWWHGVTATLEVNGDGSMLTM